MEDDDSMYANELLPKRKRDRNFSEEEQLLLAELVKPYLEIFENKSCSQTAIDLKERTWLEVSEQYNLSHPSFPREWRKLRDLYQRMKIKAKKEASELFQQESSADGEHRLSTQINNGKSVVEMATKEVEVNDGAFESTGSASNSNAHCKSDEHSVEASCCEGDVAVVKPQATPTYKIRIESVSPAATLWKDKRVISASSKCQPAGTSRSVSAGNITLKRTGLSYPSASAAFHRKISFTKRAREDNANASGFNRLDDRLRYMEIERHRKAMEVYEEQLLAARSQRLYYDYKLKLLRSNCGS